MVDPVTPQGAHSNAVRISVADPDILFRGILQDALQPLGDNLALTFFDDFVALRKTLAKQPHPSLIIIDPMVNGVGGLRGVLALKAVAPNTPFVIASQHPNAAFVGHAMRFGANGFIGKSLNTSELLKSITTLLAGEKLVNPDVPAVETDDLAEKIYGRYDTLTKQQARVLGFLSDGLLNKQIAYELNVSEATVKAHVSAILLKLDVPSRVAAVAAITSISSSYRPTAS
jgi:DNA-binding NarL/FixJ family response regulator